MLKTYVSRDFTFNQDLGVAEAKKLTMRDFDLLASLDLTAATDRLPVWYQEKILALLFGSDEIAYCWREILTNRSFYLTDTKEYIRYATGQPMGLKSSFAMLALMHHVIVQLAIMESDNGSNLDYVLLGDDIVLGGEVVVEAYRAYMAKLGQEISEHKSIFSRRVNGTTHGCEFCKRAIRGGQDISGIPPGILLRVSQRSKFGPQLQNELVKRNLILNDSQFWILMERLLTPKWFLNMVLLNGMSTEVSGLLKRIPNRWYPFYNDFNVSKLYNFSVEDWVEVSKFLELKQAFESFAFAYKKLINGEGPEIPNKLLETVFKSGFTPPALHFLSNQPYVAAMDDADMKLISGEAFQPIDFGISLPTGLEKLAKFASIHPFLDVVFRDLKVFVDDIIQWRLTSESIDVVTRSRATTRSLNMAFKLQEIQRDVSDIPGTGRDLNHVMKVVEVLRFWKRNPDKRVLTYHTRLPHDMSTLTLSVKPFHKMIVTRLPLLHRSSTQIVVPPDPLGSGFFKF
jgi:hypothetical protein